MVFHSNPPSDIWYFVNVCQQLSTFDFVRNVETAIKHVYIGFLRSLECFEQVLTMFKHFKFWNLKFQKLGTFLIVFWHVGSLSSSISIFWFQWWWRNTKNPILIYVFPFTRTLTWTRNERSAPTQMHGWDGELIFTFRGGFRRLNEQIHLLTKECILIE